jgi:hypothetical protein
LLADQSSQLCLVPQRDWAKSVKRQKAAGVTSRRSLVQKEPVLSSALLTATLLTATLLTAALLAATLLAAALLAATLLAAALFFTLVWIFFCIHDAFLCY